MGKTYAQIKQRCNDITGYHNFTFGLNSMLDRRMTTSPLYCEGTVYKQICISYEKATGVGLYVEVDSKGVMFYEI